MRGRPTTGPLDPCEQCGELGAKFAAGRRFCAACVDVFHVEARAWQEKDYLWRWLHARADVIDPRDPEYRLVQRLRAAARRQGLDWRATPPAPLTFDQRMAMLTNRPAQKPPAVKRTGKKRQPVPAA